MNATNGQLSTIVLGDPPGAWSAAGFEVRTNLVRLGSTTIQLRGSGPAFQGWGFHGVSNPVDGLPAAPPVEGGGTEHPNGISAIDHVVVRTGDCERTIGSFTAAGFDLRGGRSTTSYGSPMRQAFFWAGDVIIEVVGPDEGEPTTDEVTSIFGLALVAEDLDTTTAQLGDLIGAPKQAVQPGRRIAGLRHRQVGIGLPLAVMSPHVRPA